MRLSSGAVWSVVTLLATPGLGADTGGAGVLEIDLVFPRTNETYAPTPYLPLVFGFRNAKLARHLDLDLLVDLHTTGRLDGGLLDPPVLAGVNWTSQEPYFAYTLQVLNTEGTFSLGWYAQWAECKADRDGVFRGHTKQNYSEMRSPYRVEFAIKNGASAYNLMATTAPARPCATVGLTGQLVNVTEEPNAANQGSRELETCAVVAPASPTATAGSCRLTIDADTAANITAKVTYRLCRKTKSSAECSTNAAQRAAVAGVASLAALLGAVGFVLA